MTQGSKSLFALFGALILAHGAAFAKRAIIGVCAGTRCSGHRMTRYCDRIKKSTVSICRGFRTMTNWKL